MTARLGQAFPRGWRDFVLQLGVWFGFLLAYQLARGVADHDAAQAFVNGRAIIAFEAKLRALVEVDIQNVVLRAGDWFVQVLNWTYWNSQFTVVGIALLWVYFRRNDAFPRLRNILILANVLALVGFIAMPTAPPRMFPEWGFVDTLAQSAALNHGSSLVELASNQFAAMPSIHSADALILGFAMVSLVRSAWAKVLWTLWPSWVWFTVMATGNHYWLDVAAGIAIAILAASVVMWVENSKARETLARVIVRS